MRPASRGISALVLAFAVLGCGRPPLPKSAVSPLLGKRMPTVQRRAIDGRAVDSDAHGQKTVVVEFFAQYCEPCKRTLPAAQALSNDRSDVVVIGVAEDADESVVRELVASYGLTFAVIHDRDHVLSGRFRVTDIPASFVAAPDRTLRWFGGPGQRPGDLEQAVEALAP